MARVIRRARTVPTDVPGLSFARYLAPHDAALDPAEDYQHALWSEAELEDVTAGGVRFSECAFSAATVTGGDFRQARWHDVWIGRSRLLGSDLSETDWRDVDVVASSLAGVAASGSTLRRVTFVECRIATLNLRFCTLTDVVFRDCEITDMDLASATVKNASFPGSTIDRLRLNATTFSAVDFAGAASIGVVGDVASMSGSTIDVGQLAELAPALAVGLGITVRGLD